jgi:ABC-type branched-subunit amino acid transport system substrate-binding protein
MNRVTWNAVLLLAVLMAGATARAQELTGEQALKAARAHYADNQFDSTVAILRGFLSKGGKEPITEQIVPLLCEALIRTGDNEYVARLLTIFEKKFAESPLLPRMYYLGGIARARAGRYVESMDAFVVALAGGLRPGLDSLARQALVLLCDKSLSTGDISSRLRRGDLPDAAREALQFGLVKKHFTKRQLARAGRAAQDFLQLFPQSRYAPLVQDIAASSSEQKGGQVSVGLLAPLSGYDADIGKRITQGAQLAVDEYNASATTPVKLIIADTRGSGVRTAQKTWELINDFEAPVLIGPVLSQNAAVAAAMLMEREPVMVSPSATEDGIAELGSNVFQMNVTTGVLGRTIAEYAMRNLNIAEFAIMTPLSEYGRVLSEEFKEEVKRLGGTVVAEEFFEEGANDFRRQFLSLRATLFALRRARDSVVAMEAGIRPDAASRRADSLRLADSALTVGGLFIPAESEDVVMLAPQAYFYKIQTQMLGATGWHSNKTILDGKRYVDNAVFVTPAETERTDSLWIGFVNRYKARFGTEPDRVSALGYDAGKLVCAKLSELGGAFSTARFAAALRETQGWRGVAGTVSFDAGRGVNREAIIMKILDRKFIRVR